MDTKQSAAALQAIATGLTEGALVHKMQGQIFKSQGFAKLGEKYIDHFNEEMGWVEKCVDRLIDLGCQPLAQDLKGRDLLTDPEAYIRQDLTIQREGVDALYQMLPALACDPTTYDLVKGYLKDEEEDLYWSENQLELIGKIGIQNWLVSQM